MLARKTAGRIANGGGRLEVDREMIRCLETTRGNWKRRREITAEQEDGKEIEAAWRIANGGGRLKVKRESIRC